MAYGVSKSKKLSRKKMVKIHSSANIRLLALVALSDRTARNLRVIPWKLESHRRVKYVLHMLERQEIYACRLWKI